jgi:hypothetical protein
MISAGASRMSEFDDDRAPDGDLDPEEEARASLLTDVEIQRIDACLLSHTSHQWRKVARVILHTMMELSPQEMPDRFYARRIKHLAATGMIESVGNLNRMRYSEIRLPAQKSNET